MQFVVRYWSPYLPDEHREADGSPRLVDYSTHPPSKLGLHNALLSQHDRIEILAAHGGAYACEVFVVEGDTAEVLTQEMALSLFYSLTDGEVRWTDIREFLLPQARRVKAADMNRGISHERQLQLFEYTHEAYAEPPSHHRLDVDA